MIAVIDSPAMNEDRAQTPKVRKLPKAKPLRRLREREALTQQELAVAAGVQQGTISRIEGGHQPRLRFSTIRAIAGALRVDPAQVVEFRASLGLAPAKGYGPHDGEPAEATEPAEDDEPAEPAEPDA